jgi:hypothetical protein
LTSSADGESNETMVDEDGDEEEDSFLKNENLEALFSMNSSVNTKRFRKE